MIYAYDPILDITYWNYRMMWSLPLIIRFDEEYFKELQRPLKVFLLTQVLYLHEKLFPDDENVLRLYTSMQQIINTEGELPSPSNAEAPQSPFESPFRPPRVHSTRFLFPPPRECKAFL